MLATSLERVSKQMVRAVQREEALRRNPTKEVGELVGSRWIRRGHTANMLTLLGLT